MKKIRRAALLLLAALAVSAAGAEGMPDVPGAEIRRTYELVIEAEGPVDISITHPAAETGGEPVRDADHAPAGTYVLPEGPEYDVRLEGKGEGALTYTVTRRDPAGEEEDKILHRFENIPAGENSVFTTVTGRETQNTLLAWTREGEGDAAKLTPGAAYGSAANSAMVTVNPQNVILAGILVLILAARLLLMRRRRRMVKLQKPILLRKG